MKLFKAISNSICNTLGILDDVIDGSRNVSKIYADATANIRHEYAIEAFKDNKELAKKFDLSEEDIRAIQQSLL